MVLLPSLPSITQQRKTTFHPIHWAPLKPHTHWAPLKATHTRALDSKGAQRASIRTCSLALRCIRSVAAFVCSVYRVIINKRKISNTQKNNTASVARLNICPGALWNWTATHVHMPSRSAVAGRTLATEQVQETWDENQSLVKLIMIPATAGCAGNNLCANQLKRI